MKDKFNHTPGPWTYVGNVDHEHVQKTQLVLQEQRRDARNIANVIPCMGMTANEVESNARLMASSPRLFSSLKAMIKAWEKLAEATGEEGLLDEDEVYQEAKRVIEIIKNESNSKKS